MYHRNTYRAIKKSYNWLKNPAFLRSRAEKYWLNVIRGREIWIGNLIRVTSVTNVPRSRPEKSLFVWFKTNIFILFKGSTREYLKLSTLLFWPIYTRNALTNLFSRFYLNECFQIFWNFSCELFITKILSTFLEKMKLGWIDFLLSFWDTCSWEFLNPISY